MQHGACTVQDAHSRKKEEPSRKLAELKNALGILGGGGLSDTLRLDSCMCLNHREMDKLDVEHAKLKATLKESARSPRSQRARARR